MLPYLCPRHIGLYFFTDDRGGRTTVSAKCYFKMLFTFSSCEMAWMQVREGTWFQQDTAVQYLVHISMMVLHNLLPNYLVLSFVGIVFPDRSLNLTDTDFFVWDCFKSVVFCS